MRRKDSNCVAILSDQGKLQLLQTSLNILYQYTGETNIFHSCYELCLSRSVSFGRANHSILAPVISYFCVTNVVSMSVEENFLVHKGQR